MKGNTSLIHNFNSGKSAGQVRINGLRTGPGRHDAPRYSFTPDLIKRLRPILISFLILTIIYILLKGLSTMVVFQITGSMPMGLYLKRPVTDIRPGQYLLFDIPDNVNEMVKDRRWAPRQVTMLMKVVFGMPGDKVQINKAGVYLNSIYFGPVKKEDSQGRPLPVIYKQYILQKDEYFLASRLENSFDSRYFGPVHLQDIKAVVEPVFTIH